MAHKTFIGFLVMIVVTATVVVGVHGFTYYTTPVDLRPFQSDYEGMKLPGVYSHGLGVTGGSMITIGVALYSTRKRIHALWNLGRLSHWLEIHIFLCLLGPILVIYHTTFKGSGIAGISLWTMLSVAVSGVVGRFLYVQIPRNLKGAELTDTQISEELQQLGTRLSSSPLGMRLAQEVDQVFASLSVPESLFETAKTFIRLRSVRRHVKRSVRAIIAGSPQTKEDAREIYTAAVSRATLHQKAIILGQAAKLFYYWHIVHVPFTVIMFITLAAHVAVNVLLGYTWIF